MLSLLERAAARTTRQLAEVGGPERSGQISQAMGDVAAFPSGWAHWLHATRRVVPTDRHAKSLRCRPM